jgi:hypothetical protein
VAGCSPKGAAVCGIGKPHIAVRNEGERNSELIVFDAERRSWFAQQASCGQASGVWTVLRRCYCLPEQGSGRNDEEKSVFHYINEAHISTNCNVRMS